MFTLNYLYPTEVRVCLNEVVRLPCPKPSNLATLTWTFPKSKNLPGFIQSCDHSLSFLATAVTFGTYRCEAEEDGYKEVVVSYDVQQTTSPHSQNPSPNGDMAGVSKDKSYGDSATDIFMKQPSGDTEDQGNESTGTLKDETISCSEDSELKSNFQDNSTQTQDKQVDGAGKVKSYYSELVVVSFLLVVCICILAFGGVHIWRQQKTQVKINPLVSLEPGPEVVE